METNLFSGTPISVSKGQTVRLKSPQPLAWGSDGAFSASSSVILSWITVWHSTLPRRQAAATAKKEKTKNKTNTRLALAATEKKNGEQKVERQKEKRNRAARSQFPLRKVNKCWWVKWKLPLNTKRLKS